MAGCGGNGTSDGKAQYVRQLDQAEVKLDRTLTRIRKDVVPGTPISVIGTKLDEGAAALDQAARDFRAIEAPSYTRFLAAFAARFLKGDESPMGLVRS